VQGGRKKKVPLIGEFLNAKKPPALGRGGKRKTHTESVGPFTYSKRSSGGLKVPAHKENRKENLREKERPKKQGYT